MLFQRFADHLESRKPGLHIPETFGACRDL